MHFFSGATSVICLKLWEHIDKNVAKWQEEGKARIVPWIIFM
jgi:DNA helicase TIP49 (TBP-interacting protein)